MKDITNSDVMLELQGDVVLVVLDKRTMPLTVVHFIDDSGERLELEDRQAKTYSRWPLMQELADLLVPSKNPAAKWVLNLNLWPTPYASSV